MKKEEEDVDADVDVDVDVDVVISRRNVVVVPTNDLRDIGRSDKLYL